VANLFDMWNMGIEAVATAQALAQNVTIA